MSSRSYRRRSNRLQSDEMNLGWCTFSRAGRTYGSPLDPAVAQIIPLLPLRDPNTMTPQSARDALRALAAARADIPPPPVKSIDETELWEQRRGFLRVSIAALGRN